ncbi:MAG: T9SS type A sorting domain-containing protein [Flavobacteriaceae bacterium]|nr:T9SS type A sorting domain-containing protein [Flavobacteriaceae bacterium]
MIQAHAFDNDLKIPLIIKANEDLLVNFRLGDIQHFAEDQGIYLHDKVNAIYIDLRDINYDLILEGGDYDNRFEITFNNQDTLEDEEALLKDLRIFQDNAQHQFTILNPTALPVSQVKIFDMSGKLILDQIGLNTQDEYHFSTTGMSDGVYMALIDLKNAGSINKKIIIKN